MSSLLNVSGLKKSFHNGPQILEVLKGIDLDVKRGEIVVIMGPSGVGKSTLLHLIGGLDRPTTGSVRIDDTDIFNMRDRELALFRNRHIGFVFQFHHLLPEFDALENILLPGMMHQNNQKIIENKARHLLGEVGLSERELHKPTQLSGGERQRVAVARALINEPDLVLADEPTGNLDRKNGEALYHLMLELNKKFNQTFVIVTHNELMAAQASRVIEMEDGCVKSNKTR